MWFKWKEETPGFTVEWLSWTVSWLGWLVQSRQYRNVIRIYTYSSTKYCGSRFPQCLALLGVNKQCIKRLTTFQSKARDGELEVGPLMPPLVPALTMTPGRLQDLQGLCSSRSFPVPPKGQSVILRPSAPPKKRLKGLMWDRGWETAVKHTQPLLPSSFNRTTAIFLQLPLRASSELLFLEQITTPVQMRFHAV